MGLLGLASGPVRFREWDKLVDTLGQTSGAIRSGKWATGSKKFADGVSQAGLLNWMKGSLCLASAVIRDRA